MIVRNKNSRYRKKKGFKIITVSFSTLAVCLVAFITYYHLDWSVLADLSFYENLANPSIKVVQVPEGLRKEQIAELVGDKLGWNDIQRNQFINAHLTLNQTNLEGHYFPKTYMLARNATPTSVSTTMFNEFSKQTSTVKKPKTSVVVNQDTILKIASIIQREAAGKQDMKLISGIIWNRIFSGMRLQMDATLQYAKGSEVDGWWTPVNPEDKAIDSPYNTYIYKDLPPSPIDNPGLASIEAAYNPQKTSCMYYLHDKRGVIHCSATYEGHKQNISRYY